MTISNFKKLGTIHGKCFSSLLDFDKKAIIDSMKNKKGLDLTEVIDRKKDSSCGDIVSLFNNEHLMHLKKVLSSRKNDEEYSSEYNGNYFFSYTLKDILYKGFEFNLIFSLFSISVNGFKLVPIITLYSKGANVLGGKNVHIKLFDDYLIDRLNNCTDNDTIKQDEILLDRIKEIANSIMEELYVLIDSKSEVLFKKNDIQKLIDKEESLAKYQMEINKNKK